MKARNRSMCEKQGGASACGKRLVAGTQALSVIIALLAVTAVAQGQPCVVPDNGSGTITLPPEGCEYLSPDEVHMIIDGLPPGTTIELAAIHQDFICHEHTGSICSLPIPPGICEIPGGSLGGNGDCFESTLDMDLKGTGGLAGWTKLLTLPVSCEVHTGPRNPGAPVQTFPSDMFRLFGQVTGDPDFDLLRVTGGTDFGLPSPGQTTLRLRPDGRWNVDSFFDITYRIDFVGSPRGPLAGMSGSTTATIRMGARGPGGPCECPGDINVDYLINGKDIQDFVDCMLGLVTDPTVNCLCGDMDGSGGMNLADVPVFVQALVNDMPCAGYICISPGEDCWVTNCGPTSYGFIQTPIPAGFFGPGSDPFAGDVYLGGTHLGPYGTDTRVARLMEMCFPMPLPSSATTPIQLTALDLASCQPITVTYMGGQNPEPWDVAVGLSSVVPPQGSMTATRERPSGGTFDAVFFVQPKFTFTQVLPPHQVLVLDTGQVGYAAMQMTSNDVPWMRNVYPFPQCGIGFAPGYVNTLSGPCCVESCHEGPAPDHLHCVIPPECTECPD